MRCRCGHNRPNLGPARGFRGACGGPPWVEPAEGLPQLRATPPCLAVRERAARLELERIWGSAPAFSATCRRLEKGLADGKPHECASFETRPARTRKDQLCSGSDFGAATDLHGRAPIPTRRAPDPEINSTAESRATKTHHRLNLIPKLPGESSNAPCSGTRGVFRPQGDIENRTPDNYTRTHTDVDGSDGPCCNEHVRRASVRVPDRAWM